MTGRDIIDYVVITFAFSGMGFAIFMMWREWPSRKERQNVQKMKEHAGRILRWTVEGHTTGRELCLSDILMLGINPGCHHMGTVYFSFIQSLDIQTRVQIIDNILDHSRLRCEENQTPDLVQTVSMLNDTESETIIMCMVQKAEVPEWAQSHVMKFDASRFANEIIAFRLANP